MTNEHETQPSSTDERSANPTQKRQLKDRLDVSETVLKDAVEWYQQVATADISDVDEDVLPIAVLYIAIRQHGVPRNIDEVAEVAHVSTRKLYRTARTVGKHLEQGIPPADPEIYVGRIADEFDVPVEAEQVALRTLSAAKAAGHHSGRNPEAVAAAAVYVGAIETGNNELVSQRELSETTSVHKRTIRKSYKRMQELGSVDE